MKYSNNRLVATIIFTLFTLSLGQIWGMERSLKNNQEDKDYANNIPKSIDAFKVQHKNIDLSSTTTKDIPLNFEQSQDIAAIEITHHLLNGKNIAELIQINKSMRFKSSDPDTYNFLLKSPLKTDCFEVETLGKFTFYESVEAFSALLTCKSAAFLNIFKAHNIYFSGEDVENRGTLSAEERLDVKAKNTILESESRTIAKQASLKVTDSLCNKGKFEVENFLLLRSKYIKNNGTLSANDIHIKADRSWLNAIGATVRAKNSLAIDALSSVNLGAFIDAHDVTINAGCDLNIGGFYWAKNTNANALVGLNLGIYLSKLDLKDFFTLESVWKVGISLLSQFSPQIGLAYSLFKNISGLYYQGKALYNQVRSLSYEDIGVSDFIPLICNIKNIKTSAAQTQQLVEQLNLDIKLMQSGEKSLNEIPKTISWTNVAKKTGCDLISSCGPHINKDLFLDWNYGLLLGVNANLKSVYSIHKRTSLSAFMHTYMLDTYCGQNSGRLIAPYPIVKAQYFYRNNAFIAGLLVAMNAYRLDIGGKINVRYLALKTEKKACIRAQTNAKTINIQGERVEIGKVPHLSDIIDIFDIPMIVLYLFDPSKWYEEASISGEQIYINGNAIELNKKSTIHVHGNESAILLKAHDRIELDGVLAVQKNLYVEAPTIIKDGSLQASNMFEKGTNILVNQASTIIVQSASIEARETFTSDGNIKVTEQFVMQARNSSLEKNSQINVGNAHIKVQETLKNKGNLQASETLFTNGKYIENMGFIVAKDAHIKADRWWWNSWWYGGTVKIQNHLTVDALLAMNMGIMSAHNLTINAAANFNFGIYYAINQNINAIFSLDHGLSIPRIESWQDFKSLATQDNAKKVGLFLLRKYMPALGIALSAFLTVKFILDNREKIDKNIKNLFNKENLSKLGASDIVPVLCEIKNVGEAAIQCAKDSYNTGNNLVHGYNTLLNKNNNFCMEETQPEKSIHNISDFDLALSAAKKTASSAFTNLSNAATYLHTSDSNTIRNDTYNLAQDAYKKLSAIHWQHTGKNLGEDIVSVLGPQFTRNALINNDQNITIGINGNTNSIWNTNNGISLFANRNVINTWYGSNNGFMAATNLNIHAAKTYDNTGSIAGLDLPSVTAQNINNTGSICTLNDLTLQPDRICINAALNGHNIQIDGQNVDIKKSCTIAAHGGEVKVTADNKLSNEGKVSGDNAVIMQSKECNLGASSNIKGGIVALETNIVNGHSDNTIAATHYTHIKTNQLDNQGSTQGKLVVDHTGSTDQLQSIGKVDHLQYKGTLQDGVLDKLIQGKNNLVDINQSGSVFLIGGTEDIHIKEQHVDHTVIVTNVGSITSETLTSAHGSIGLQSDKNIHHDSLCAEGGSVNISAKGKVSASSQVERKVDGANYTDDVKRVVVTATNGIRIDAGKNEYQGVLTKSGKEGTVITVDGKVIQDATISEWHTEHKLLDNKQQQTGLTTDTCTTAIPTEHISQGQVTILSNDIVDLYGTTFDAKGGYFVDGKNGTIGHEIVNIRTIEMMTKQKGDLVFNETGASKQRSHTITTKTVDFKGSQVPVITSDSNISLPFTCEAPKIILDAPHVETLLGKNITQKSYTYAGSNLVRESKKNHVKTDVTYTPPFSGTIEANASTMHVETLSEYTPAIIPINKNMVLTRDILQEIHNHQKFSSVKPTRAALFVIATAVSMATAGLGASAGAAVATAVGCKSALSTAIITNATAAAVSSFSVQATTALLESNGDFYAAARSLASLDSFKNVVLSAAVGGAVAGVDQALTNLGVPAVHDAHNLGERLLYAAPRQAAHAAIRTVAEVAAGQNVQDAALHNLKVAAAGTIGVACTSHIGEAYGNGQIDPITHKVLHAGVGALEGAIVGGAQGALAGATGALVAETIADICAPKMPMLDDIKAHESRLGHLLNQQEFTELWNQKLTTYLQGVSTAAETAKLIAASAALLSQQDVAIAHNTASTAVDNNFLVLASYGIVAAGVAYSAYEIHNAYTQGGAEAALNQLGIEVVTHAAGIATGLAAEKVIFKVGSVVYPTAKAAITAVLDNTPGLKLMLGELSETLVVAGEKLSQSTLGKKAINLAEKVSHVEAKLINAEQKMMHKLGMVSSAEAESGAQAIKTTTKVEQATTEAATLPKDAAVAQNGAVTGNVLKIEDNLLSDLSSNAVTSNYYEVNGFKFTQYYYDRLWETGRQCPGFRAEAIFKGATNIIQDPQGYPGFYKYIYDDWEMIFNPETRVVSHLSKLKHSKTKV